MHCNNWQFFLFLFFIIFLKHVFCIPSPKGPSLVPPKGPSPIPNSRKKHCLTPTTLVYGSYLSSCLHVCLLRVEILFSLFQVCKATLHYGQVFLVPDPGMLLQVLINHH